MYTWIRAFLIETEQRVKVNGAMSDWCRMTNDILQGSVMGPASFAVFINNLLDMVEGKVQMFTDDTKLYSPAETTQKTEIQYYKRTWTV